MDRHVMEPVAMWRAYLPAALRDHAPRYAPFGPPESLAERARRLGEHALLPNLPILSVASRSVMRVPEIAYIELGVIAERRREQLEAAQTARGQLAEMDATGVDVAVVLPTYGSYLVDDDGIDAERSRGYAGA
jgi:hypothetical protein